MKAEIATPDFDAATASALIDSQRAKASARERRNIAAIVGTWGLVWIVGHFAVWSGQAGGNPWFRLPENVEWWVLGGLIAFGSTVAAVLGISMGRGTRGPSRSGGALYGVAFGIGAVAIMLFDLGLLRAGLTQDQASLLFPSTFAFLIGALYMAGGAATGRGRLDLAQFITGVTLIASAVVATFVGAPHHLLVYSVAGFAFLVGAISILRRRSA